MRVHTGVCIVCVIFAYCSLCVGAERERQLTASEQSAVVTALTLVNGYARPNQYVLVKHERAANDTHRITIWVESVKDWANDVPPRRLAVVETSRPNMEEEMTEENVPRIVRDGRRGAQVKYQGERAPPSGNEAACRSAVAYLAQQGWLRSGFWMNCSADGDKHSVLFLPEPNLYPGDHCRIGVSDTEIRFKGGL